MELSIVWLCWYLVALFAILGGTIASFAGVVSERGADGRSILGRSRCACGRQLAWYQNVPVLGWLGVRGVARCCGARLPVWYLICEVGSSLLVGGVGAGYLVWSPEGTAAWSNPVWMLAACSGAFLGTMFVSLFETPSSP